MSTPECSARKRLPHREEDEEDEDEEEKEEKLAWKVHESPLASWL